MAPPDEAGPAGHTAAPAASEDAASGSPAARRAGVKRGHTWGQRLLLAVNVLVIIACFAGAIGLVVARRVRDDLQTVSLPDVVDLNGSTSTTPAGVPIPQEPLEPGETLPPGVTAAPVEIPENTFPAADPEAKNFLITGADNNACIDPNSPYALAFGDRSGLGERSDTVMIMRVDPTTKRAAILSFPRDLWVTNPSKRSKTRINSTYVRNDPTNLIYTIAYNFELYVDHFIQIDFCAFKTIVDSIDGGVGVPFEYAARDTKTGLYVPEPGCFYFDGESALAYVRSRYYQYYEDDKWKSDPRSDLSRISRQQDFIRRVLDAALNQGLFDPSIARGLLDAARSNVVFDENMTLSKMLEFVGVMRDIPPGGIATYQIESVGRMIAGNSVLEPRLNGENMQAILRIFRGQAELASAPAQVFETTTTSVAPTPATGSTSPTGAATSTTVASTTTVTTTTVPPVATAPPPTENVPENAIVPPRDVTC